MRFALRQDYLRRKTIATVGLALLLTLSFICWYWLQRHNWLQEITLEIEATASPRMGLTTPTEGVLYLKTGSGGEKRVRAADWTSMIPKPMSRLRFDFAFDRYQDIVFFPDPSISKINIVALRLVSHRADESIHLPVDRAQIRQHLNLVERTSTSVTFARVNEKGLPAIDLRIADLIQQLPGPVPPLVGEIVFVFGAMFLAIFCLLSVLAESLLKKGSAPLTQPANWFRIGVVLGFVACMAAGAPKNSHPDEYLHVAAAQYYAQHWLPPDLTNPWVVPTFSHYGLSYLAGTDLGYLFAGKFLLLAEPIFPSSFVALRFFNVALLAALVLWFGFTFRDSPGCWVFLITPQLWYVFSAYNTDAWGVFVALLLVAQIAFEKSSLHRYLSSASATRNVWFILPPLILSCLLLAAKKNYVLVFFFFIAWLVWRLLKARSESRLRNQLVRLIPLLLIPPLLHIGLKTYQQVANRPALSTVIAQQAEKYADSEYKPSLLRGGASKSALTNLKDRGVSLTDLLIQKGWLYYTAGSFVGAYGWLEFYSPAPFYVVMALGWAVLLGAVFVGTIRNRSGPERLLHIVGWCCLPLVIALSIYFSWVHDFEPQGRYLFPFIPVLFYLMNAATQNVAGLLSKTTWFLWALSVYGFVFVGLTSLLAPRM